MSIFTNCASSLCTSTARAGFSPKNIKSKSNINSQWCCYSFIYFSQAQKKISQGFKQYGDRWCGDNPGWAPSVKSTQLHSFMKEGRQRRKRKGEEGSGGEKSTCKAGPNHHRFLTNKNSCRPQSFSVHLYKVLCTITDAGRSTPDICQASPKKNINKFFKLNC